MQQGADTSTRVKLTERLVERATPGTSKLGTASPKIYLDTERTGFGLAVSAKGVKGYFVQRRVKGKLVRYSFARPGETPLARARIEAAELLAKMMRGVNPADERKHARAEASKKRLTLRTALEMYEERLRKKDASPITLYNIRRVIELHLSDWLDKPLAEFDRTTVRRRHTELPGRIAAKQFKKRTETSGQISANMAMRAFRAVYNYARREYPELPESPLASVEFYKQRPRRNVLARADMPEWFAAVRKIRNPTRRDFLLFVLFTGLRRTSARTVRWEHVDFEQRTLFVPRPKGGEDRAFTIPLSDYLVKLLRQRQADAWEGSPWVFTAARGDGPMTGCVTRDTQDVITRFSPHDLRRTFVTVAESLDISHYAIKLLVNHAMPSSDVTAVHYVSADVERLRAPMQTITDRLLALAGENVVQFPTMPKAAEA